MSDERIFTMDIIGEGSLMAAPDLTNIRLGVETIDMDLKRAQAENAIKMQKVLLSIRKLGVSEEDIQTQTYAINKKIEYVDGQEIDSGYVVTNIVSITLRNMSQIGEVVDTAVANGANIVQGITFTVEDPSSYYLGALALAIKDATTKAESIGRQLTVRVLRTPLQIIEESYTSTPYGNVYYAKESSTPIEPGQVQITARIRALFSYDLI